MPAPLLTLQDIHLTLGGKPLLEGAELSVEPGARLCLVGRNGSGKSTLLALLRGLYAPAPGARLEIDGRPAPLATLTRPAPPPTRTRGRLPVDATQPRLRRSSPRS